MAEHRLLCRPLERMFSARKELSPPAGLLYKWSEKSFAWTALVPWIYLTMRVTTVAQKPFIAGMVFWTSDRQSPLTESYRVLFDLPSFDEQAICATLEQAQLRALDEAREQSGDFEAFPAIHRSLLLNHVLATQAYGVES